MRGNFIFEQGRAFGKTEKLKFIVGLAETMPFSISTLHLELHIFLTDSQIVKLSWERQKEVFEIILRNSILMHIPIKQAFVSFIQALKPQPKKPNLFQRVVNWFKKVWGKIYGCMVW